jgi:hypothetical protein
MLLLLLLLLVLCAFIANGGAECQPAGGHA